MKAFLLCVMVLFGAACSFFYDVSEECIVEDENLNCICHNRESFTLSASLLFDIRHITVKGCGTVDVPFGALNYLQLKTFQVLDVEILVINPFAFMEVKAINFFRISDVTKFSLKEHGFIGLLNVNELIFNNITAPELSPYSLGFVSNIQHFLIENSRFAHLGDFSFVLTNVSTFKIINTKFQELRNNTFKIINSEEVVFENCYFKNTNQMSFSLSDINTIKFQSCEFGIVSNSAVVTNDAETFIFKNCSIDRLERGAFEFLEVSEKLIFTYNKIKMENACAVLPSVISNISMNLNVEDCCNSFQCCNCANFWILSSEYSPVDDVLLQQRNCIDDMSMNDITSFHTNDTSIKCIDFELKSVQHKAEFPSKKASVYKSKGLSLNSSVTNLFTHLLLFFISLRYFIT
ncbi:uncharacterized protein LOC118195280 [Stegodyphus dumicola]|uniref:uncharacterized protein LOC118195280 n=1 Tax=Stegodyphus dumicola TaxID=202533 RepID=UPI0015A9166C|nr:uncharacterized protein LOC118195280 [Stegodyphus dumicola]